MNYFDPYNFYFELPLYTEVEITLEQVANFHQLVSFNDKIDGYNPRIKEKTTFRVSISYHFGRDKIDPTYFDKTTKATLNCLRSGQEFEFYFHTFRKGDEGNYFMHKIGQVPSIADLHISQIRSYDRVLPKDKLREFTKAVGLAANGVGIGSFVYLRRIFEFLIEDAHKRAMKEDSWSEENYARSRVVERIDLLKRELPEFLVEHKELYGILSKGVHELDEKECLNYFVPIKLE